MLSAKMVDNDKVREIYQALENNRDLTNTWRDAKHVEFKKVFGKAKQSAVLYVLIGSKVPAVPRVAELDSEYSVRF